MTKQSNCKRIKIRGFAFLKRQKFTQILIFVILIFCQNRLRVYQIRLKIVNIKSMPFVLRISKTYVTHAFWYHGNNRNVALPPRIVFRFLRVFQVKTLITKITTSHACTLFLSMPRAVEPKDPSTTLPQNCRCEWPFVRYRRFAVRLS